MWIHNVISQLQCHIKYAVPKQDEDPSNGVLGACENIHKVTADKWIHYDTVSAEVHRQL